MTIPDVAIGPFGWTCIVVGSWLILAVLLAPLVGRAMRESDEVRATYPPPVPEVVNWIPVLPPVPPTQADIDATWLVWPSDMSQQQCDRLFDDIAASEGLDR